MSYIEDGNTFRSNTWAYIGTGIEVPYILILFWAILLKEIHARTFKKRIKDLFLP